MMNEKINIILDRLVKYYWVIDSEAGVAFLIFLLFVLIDKID